MTKKTNNKTSHSGGQGPAKPTTKQPTAKQKKKASSAANQPRMRPAERKQASTKRGERRKATAAAKPQGTTPRARQTKTSGSQETKAVEAKWELRLYIAGQSQRSMTALTNLKRLCDDHLAGKYRIEVIDLMKQPQLAAGDQILAIPTLVRKLPSPIRKIVGDLSSTERALVGLDVRAAASPSQGSDNRE